ncbi:MAG: DUF3429 domain-containing protein [Halomonadaceae bacterium]|nr:MAG: DUF3429 domain-containing protein [Halomonadaceae bacterium]
MLSVHRLAITCGLGGMIPFILGLLAIWFWPGGADMAAKLFFLYSAGILAFMAGVYWPIGMQLEDRSYPISPVNALLLSQFFFITAALSVLLPYQFAIIVFPLLYLLLYLTDRRIMGGYWPDWYLKLRLALTIVVISSQIGVGIALLAGVI